MQDPYTRQLLQTRVDLMIQMQRALACRTKKQKIKLAREWKEKYSENMYKELIACAKDKRVRANIVNWENDGRI
jgi:hypothetical protein